MKTQPKGVFHYIFLLALVLVALRFLPVIIRILQAIVVGVRGFWWVILPSLVVGWLVWRARKHIRSRNGAETSLRDVTNGTDRTTSGD